ncbi:MAG: 50S ribosomal protein L10 [Clostridiales bacterium]|jgi:large subunit ribosomal protein L10|nr:50S ribosomal protein L10 [Clostridiales bacterium]
MSTEIMKVKEQIVSDYAEKLAKAKSFVIVDYRGLTVAEDTQLRKELRENNVEYSVVKNRLTLRAMEKAGFTGLDQVLTGPTAVAISYDDAVAPAKVLVTNAKKNNKLEVKGGMVEGKILSVNEINGVASIPAKPVLIAQLLGMLQTPIRGLAVALSEIAKKQEA